MTNFVKIKITACSEGGKYADMVGDHGMAYDEGTHYRIPRSNVKVRKEDCELCDDIGRNF
jgi:hypothetical protein